MCSAYQCGHVDMFSTENFNEFYIGSPPDEMLCFCWTEPDRNMTSERDFFKFFRWLKIGCLIKMADALLYLIKILMVSAAEPPVRNHFEKIIGRAAEHSCAEILEAFSVLRSLQQSAKQQR